MTSNGLVISLQWLPNFLNGLCYKGGHSFSYFPAVERKDLIGSLITDITQELAKHDSEVVLEAFVDVSTQLDAKSLQRFEELMESIILRLKFDCEQNDSKHRDAS